MKIKSLDLVWLALLAATAVTWRLGVGHTLAQGRLALTALVLGLAWLKGLGVLLEFMELRHAPPGWRWALMAALTVVVTLIFLAAALAHHAAAT
jgi:hypothetical protein